ncbi:MAG TPA: inverse autotransporter beta domain-containing protein [Deltaproteobacteria bacterium]|nr:inverse autotransporter beta domain-containing protein [Deltaproteobacteria bacterium]
MKKTALVLMGILSFWAVAAQAAEAPEVIWAGGGLRLADESAPAYMGDVFVSLAQVDNLYLFTNPTAFVRESELGLNLGIGARVPVLAGKAVAGYNMFFDYTTDNNHRRVGTGAEFFHPNFSAHLNLYLPFSNEHDGEEALPGVDVAFGIPVPSAPFVVVWPGAYFYNGEDRSNMKGVSLMVQVKPVRAVSLYFGGRNDALESGRNDRGEIFAKVEVTIPMKRLGEDLFRFDRGQYPLNVNSQLDHRVVREPFITYEQSR